MRITALNRGGLSIFGGLYDAHRNEVAVQVRNGETEAVSIEYQSAPTAISTTSSGVTATTPAISGTKAKLTLSGLNDGGHIDITATVNGEIRTIRIRARSETWVDRYDCTPGLIGA